MVTANGIPTKGPWARCVFGFIRLAATVFVLALGVLPLVVAEAPAQSRGKFVRFPAPPEGRAVVLPSPTIPLKCKLHKFKPRLDYELRLFTGFWIEIPTKQLAGPETDWYVTLVVRPLSREGMEPIRSDQQVTMAEIPAKAKGLIEFSGSFAMGEGSYDVSWHLRDQTGRYCDVSWDVEAKLSRGDRKVELALRPGEVAPSTIYLFRREPPSEENRDGPNLRIKVLLNLDSGSRRRVARRLWRYGAMLSTLRLLARHPDTYQFSVVAYSFEDQSVLHRHALANQINFPALGRALQNLSPGTVDFGDLGKGKETDFFSRLLQDEVTNDGTIDALVFLGHDPFTEKRVAEEFVRSLDWGGYPVFYLNSSRHPWRGIVGQAVRTLGGKTYSIRRPSELSSALDKMLARIRQR